MKSCENCGKMLSDEEEFCPDCGGQSFQDVSETIEDDFNVLYDIDDFDVFEEGKHEAERKRKLFHRIVLVIIIGAVLAFISVRIVQNINKPEPEENTEYVTEHETSEDESNKENIPVDNDENSEPRVIEGGNGIEGENNIDDLKGEVKNICSNYNNRRTPYDGQLIGVVNDGTTVTATYIIPDALMFEEREGVAEVEEEIKKKFADELGGKFPQEIKVNVKIKVSYR